jgi:endonuclease YncB( thermonuclease family)
MQTVVTVLAMVLLVAACAPNAVRVAAGLRVIDGDTIDWNGQRWRLAAHDAPELYGHCAYERESAWSHTLQPVRCWHGARDHYGRRCAIVKVAGEDVGQTLVREGLAVPFPQPTRARPWCVHPRD